MTLENEIAFIISEGRYSEQSNISIAHKIVRMLKRRANNEVKPTRGIGMVSQADVLKP